MGVLNIRCALPLLPPDDPLTGCRADDRGGYGFSAAGTIGHVTCDVRRKSGKERSMAETYNGYCVKCKEKRDFDGEVTETNGRRMAKGTCPVCGTKMNRILGKA